MKYYWPERGETSEDARDVPRWAESALHEVVVQRLCEHDHRGDFWHRDTLALIHDGATVYFLVVVETCIEFRIVERRTA